MEWSKIVKELRISMCLTQEEFAHLLGVSFVSVNRYENGKSVPTMKIKRLILNYLSDARTGGVKKYEKNVY